MIKPIGFSRINRDTTKKAAVRQMVDSFQNEMILGVSVILGCTRREMREWMWDEYCPLLLRNIN